LFNIGSTSGLLSFNVAPDKESPTDRTYDVEVQVSDGVASVSKLISVDVNDVDEFAVSFPSDQDSSDNDVNESASIGDTVGVTALATDNDATDTVTYSLVDDAGGLFSIDANGVIRVAGALDAETATSHEVTVRVTSDGSLFKDASFTINVLDNDEFTLSAISDADITSDTVVDNAVNSTPVGITALATDPDVDDVVTYSLSNDAGGLFAIDANSGVVTVAGTLDAGAASSHLITVEASSSGGDTSSADFTIAVTYPNNFSVTTPDDIVPGVNEKDEDAAVGDLVGIFITAVDLDIQDSVTLSLSNDAGGRFLITAAGSVQVAAALDAETATSHTITVRATSTDGSIAEADFSILVNDVDEFALSAVTNSDTATNSVGENAAIGAGVGVQALATDADISDTVTYALTNNAGGLFAIDTNTGVVTVAGALDAETATSHTITVQANSTRSGTTSSDFVINVTDFSEFSTTTPIDSDTDPDQVAETASVGDTVGLEIVATDADVSDTISYSLTNDAGGLFSIDAGGIVRVAGELDAETATSHSITVRATSTDGSFEDSNFTIAVQDIDEHALSAVSDGDPLSNSVSENAAIGAVVGVQAQATDADVGDTVTYALTNNAGGLFDIDSSIGVVNVAGALDAETATSHTITVQATSTRSGTTSSDFVINVTDFNEFSTTTPLDTDTDPDQVSENASVGDTVGLEIVATDTDVSDTINYTLTNDAGGLFSIDAGGIVRVAGGLDAESATSHSITVRATSTDGSFEDSNFTIGVQDIDEHTLSAVSDSDFLANSVAENSAIGSVVRIQAQATDADVGDTVSYALINDAGGLFAIDSNTGIVTVAGALDTETATSHTITVQATSTRSGTTSSDFVINVTDVNEFSITTPVDSDTDPDLVAENASVGDSVGLEIVATDADVSDSISYSLTDDAGGLFSIDAGGIVRVAGGLDAETTTSHSISVRATSSDSSFEDSNFTIAVQDIDEHALSAVIDSDPLTNSVSENAAIGSAVGVQAQATDADLSDTVTYALTNNAGGLFTIDSNTGIVTVAGVLDAETATSHTIAVHATSTRSGTSSSDFVINVTDFNEFSSTTPLDVDTDTDQVAENTTIGDTVGLEIVATDADVSDTISYSLTLPDQ